MKILIIGAGMYVSGREESGPGTILSSIAESSKYFSIEDVTVVATNPANEATIIDAVARINYTIGSALNVLYKNISGNADTDIPILCSEKSYDCAIVSIPDHLHYSYTKALLLQKVHCLVVKPFTATLDQAMELEQIRQSLGVYGAVEFHKRWDVTNLWIKRAISEQLLGELLYFTVDYSQKISIPLTTFRGWSDRTNIFQYLGVHYVDLIWFMTGFIPVRVMAVGTYGALRTQGIDTWDSVHVTIIWKNPINPDNSFVSQFTTNWIDPVCSTAMSDQRYKVIGTKGRIECDQKNRGVELVHEDKGVQQINPYFANYLPDTNGSIRFCGYGHDSIRQFLQDIINIKTNLTSVHNLEKIRPTFRQAIVSSAVIDSVNQSLSDNFIWKDIYEIF
jgi:D-galacturonate reductase